MSLVFWNTSSESWRQPPSKLRGSGEGSGEPGGSDPPIIIGPPPPGGPPPGGPPGAPGPPGPACPPGAPPGGPPYGGDCAHAAVQASNAIAASAPPIEIFFICISVLMRLCPCTDWAMRL